MANTGTLATTERHDLFFSTSSTVQNNQSNSAAAIPVWFTSEPTAGNGPFPNAQNLAGGAIPVHVVAKPSNASSYPNAPNNIAGAIPVRVVSQPGAGPWSNDQTQNGGAIPVWETGSLSGSWSVNQTKVTSAIPVWRVN